MEYNDYVYKNCIECAIEVVVEHVFDYIKDKNPYCESRYSHPAIQEFLNDHTEVEIVQQAENINKSELQKNKYKTQFARECDEEWVQQFTEWREVTERHLRIKNSKLNRIMYVAKSRVL